MYLHPYPVPYSNYTIFFFFHSGKTKRGTVRSRFSEFTYVLFKVRIPPFSHSIPHSPRPSSQTIHTYMVHTYICVCILSQTLSPSFGQLRTGCWQTALFFFSHG